MRWRELESPEAQTLKLITLPALWQAEKPLGNILERGMPMAFSASSLFPKAIFKSDQGKFLPSFLHNATDSEHQLPE